MCSGSDTWDVKLTTAVWLVPKLTGIPLFPCYFIGWTGLTSPVLWLLDTLGSTGQITRRHIPEDLNLKLFSLCFTSWYDVACTWGCGSATTDMTQQRPWGGVRGGESVKMDDDHRTNTELPRMNTWQFEWKTECVFSYACGEAIVIKSRAINPYRTNVENRVSS